MNPWPGQYFASSQGIQAFLEYLFNKDWYVPTGHGFGLLDPLGQKCPTGQFLQIQCITRFVDFSFPKNPSTNRVLSTNRVKVHKSSQWGISFILCYKKTFKLQKTHKMSSCHNLYELIINEFKWNVKINRRNDKSSPLY